MQTGSKEQRTTIEKLYILLQTDDLDSFDDAFGPIRKKIVQLAKKRLHREEVEDVVQQTLSTLWEKRTSVRAPDHLMPFIFQILRNKLGDTYRRKKLRKEIHVSGPKVLNSLKNPTADIPELLLEEKELGRILRDAIDICAAENGTWGKVLKLLQQGLSREEIQRELGDIPMTTVYTRIYRARQSLMKILRDKFGVEI
ncbi:MAG: RNA polymerase sigma factor [Candidatus Aminicenantes bacterium]|nr:MAG: RNA polymerase sigma factor [Candidatus Aminicenantes bacterium]